MSEIRIGVVGCAGFMGKWSARAVAESEGCVLAGGTVAPGAPELGRDIGEIAGFGRIGLAAGADAAPLFAAADAIIDFTTPRAAARHAELAAQARCALVVGVTGLDAEAETALNRAAHHTAVVCAPNMSVGVTVLMALTKRVAQLLGPEDWDIEIVEMHHRRKIDAPSGTALGLGRAAAAGRGVELDDVRQSTRDGVTGPRRVGDIGFATLRGGAVVSEHTVIFAGEDERIHLAHDGTSRGIFARGAVRAAKWAVGRAPGLFDMADVLGL